MRKVIYRLAKLDDPDRADNMDVVEAANTALENVENLATRVENLEAKIEVLENRAPDPSQKAYEDMDKADKVTVVRQKLKDVAENTNGKAAMTYKDVLAIFDGRPSAGHAYDIMRSVKEVDGYDYGQNREGQKRITVNLKKTSS
jgi:chemotaxis regulatin CheY-phosphate phosphatase CheZ